MPADIENILERLSRSKFRGRFCLKAKDKDYVRQKGLKTIRRHAEDFIAKRIAPARISNDGRQTPMKGHPVFVAQHATACCCRQCISKWHGFMPGTELTAEQQKYLTDVIMRWIEIQNQSPYAAPSPVDIIPKRREKPRTPVSGDSRRQKNRQYPTENLLI